jgi:hypothetical protein
MNPLDIYQQALDVVSNAVMAGDFDTYTAQIDLPYLILTYNGRHLITRAEDLRQTFETLSRGLAMRGVTHYERVAREADYVGRDRIEGRHFTHFIAHGERVLHPKAVRQTIVRRGENWLFSDVCYPIDAPVWPFDDKTMFAPDAIKLPGKGVA